MRLILLSGLLLLGIFLANGNETESCRETVNELMIVVLDLQREVSTVKYAALRRLKAQSFGTGTEKVYETNNKFTKFEAIGDICDKAGGNIPSPKIENENKLFANFLEKHNKEAYLVMADSANFTNWAEGHPNKAEGACVKADSHGSWHSASCDDDLLVVCEFDLGL